MKILMMRPLIEEGGVQRFMELLGGGLVARGHSVTVVAHADRLPGRLAEHGVEVRTCPLYPSTVANLALATRAVAALVSEEQYDLLLSTHRFTTMVGKLVSLITRVPMIATLHERPRHLGRLAGFWTGRCTVVPSQALKDDLVTRLRQNSEHIVVIPNGITLLNPAPLDRVAALRASLGLKPDIPVIGYVGRLSPEKGVHDLLDSLALLRTRETPFQAIIVGDGVIGLSLKERAVEMQLQDQIIFTGNRSDVPDLMALMDVVAVPSVHESFGLVILEAMNAMRPVVATRVGGIPDLVQEDVTGILVPPASPQAFAGALARLIVDPECCQRMGYAGRKIVEMRYSANVMVERYLDLFQHNKLDDLHR